jgi:hypothetical protein
MTTSSIDGGERLVLPMEGWSDIGDVAPPDGRALAMVGAVAIAVDAALRSGVLGIGGASVFVASAVGLVASGRTRNRAAIPLLAAAAVLGAFLAVRTSDWILPFDILAALALLGFGASFARDGDPFDVTVPRLVGRVLHLVAHGVLAPAFPFLGRGPTRVAGARVRGLLLALPVVLVVVALLSSADAVFASFLRVPDVPDVWLHVVLLVAGAWWASALLRAASSPSFTMPHRPGVTIGAQEVSTVLGALSAVLGAFAVTQIIAAVGGADYVERTSGLSYAEYARSGFFQLLAVGFVSLATTWMLRPSFSERGHRVLGVVVATGNLGIVAVAIRRLFLYEAAYGLTPLRVGAVLVAIWIGAVFVMTAIAIVRRADRAWLLPASIAAAVALLIAANTVNLDGYIAERNIERFAGTGKLDVAALAALSDDALPAIAAAVDDLDDADRTAMTDAVCGPGAAEGESRSWVGWNLGRARADAARRTICEGAAHR